MKLMKKLNFAYFNFIANNGNGDRDDPEKKIYTIVLNNGKIRQTFKIPGVYLDSPEDIHKMDNEIWVQFLYPSMKPVQVRHSTEEVIEVYIKLSSSEDKLSMSEQTFSAIKSLMKKNLESNPVRSIGRIGVYDIYEEENEEDNHYTTTYFTRDREGNLLSFRDDGYRINALRRHAGVIEISTLYPIYLRSRQLDLGKEVVKLIDSWLQK